MDEKDREIPAKDDGAEGVIGAAAAGVGAGGLLGSAMGLAVGGPVGMLVGAGVGSVVGAVTGYSIDYDSHEPEFREHHLTAHPQGRHTFEDASHAYRYGWESHDSNSDFHDATYDKIRPALHKGWTGSSDFVDYEDYVKHAWEQRAASRRLGSFSPAAKG